METVVYVDEKRMSGSDCTDAHAVRIWHEGLFLTLLIILFSATMDKEGIVYDPFEFRRFWDRERTILADQQSATVDGEPWHRLLNLGTNMFQKVSGPDGNPLSGFNGKFLKRVTKNPSPAIFQLRMARLGFGHGQSVWTCIKLKGHLIHLVEIFCTVFDKRDN